MKAFFVTTGSNGVAAAAAAAVVGEGKTKRLLNGR